MFTWLELGMRRKNGVIGAGVVKFEARSKSRYAMACRVPTKNQESDAADGDANPERE